MQLVNEDFEFHFGETGDRKWQVEVYNAYGNMTAISFRDAESASLYAKQAMVDGASKAKVYRLDYWLDHQPSRF